MIECIRSWKDIYESVFLFLNYSKIVAKIKDRTFILSALKILCEVLGIQPRYSFGFGECQDQPNEDVSRHFMNGWKDSNLKFQFNDESERSKVRRATQVITKLHEFTQTLKLIYTMFWG